MPQRKYNKTKERVSKPSKRITLAIELEEYKKIVEVPKEFRAWLDKHIACSPELFPANIENGYVLHSMRNSRKMPEITLRRIELKENGAVFTIAPSCVMPYMT